MQANNSSSGSPSTSSNVTDYETAIQALVLIFVLVVAIFGNGLVCYCVFTVRQLQIPTNYFILSLASADMLFAAICLPFRILDVLWRYAWKLNLGVCKFWIWTDLLFCSASIANLAAISVDRYSKVASPLTYDFRMTPQRVVATLVILWGYSLTVASLILVRWADDPAVQARGIIVENQICYCESKIFLTVISVIGFFVPFAIMLLMYFFVFKVALAQTRRLLQQQESLHGRTLGNHGDKSNRRRRKGSIFFEMKATKTLVILLSAFCICWSPYFVLSLISLNRPEVFDATPFWLNRLLKILFVNLLPNINAALNPVIYTTHNVQFRKAILRLICRRQRNRNFTSRNPSTTESEEMTAMKARRSPLLPSISVRFSTFAPASDETPRIGYIE